MIIDNTKKMGREISLIHISNVLKATVPPM
jgi:hypothetical protein